MPQRGRPQSKASRLAETSQLPVAIASNVFRRDAPRDIRFLMDSEMFSPIANGNMKLGMIMRHGNSVQRFGSHPLWATFENLHSHLGNFRLPLGNFLGLAFQYFVEGRTFRPGLIQGDGAAVDAELGGAEQLQLGRVG